MAAVKKFADGNRLLTFMLIMEALVLAVILYKGFSDPLAEVSIGVTDFMSNGSTPVEITEEGVGTSGASSEDSAFMISSYFSLTPGAYEIRVEYAAQAVGGLSDDDADHSAGGFTVTSDQYATAITAPTEVKMYIGGGMCLPAFT